MKYISFDIDGIMNNYPQCWVDFVNLQLGTAFITKDEIKTELGLDKYNFLKDNYRNSEFKADLPFNNEAKDLAELFIRHGYKILISTSRPFKNPKYVNLKKNTIRWLAKNGFRYDLFVDKTYELTHLDILGQIALHIDDEYEYAKQFADRKVPSILIGPRDVDDKLIYCSRNISELMSSWLLCQSIFKRPITTFREP